MATYRRRKEHDAWHWCKNCSKFFLVGKELTKNQEEKSAGQEHIQNWIAYEIGLACQKDIDVQAICDQIVLNFPMPYINNYAQLNLRDEGNAGFMRNVLEEYKKGQTFSYPFQYENGTAGFSCTPCGMYFNVHNTLGRGDKIRCPQCLKDLIVYGNIETVFRTKKSERIWHWKKNCEQWPQEEYDEIKVKGNPTDGTLCPECTRKDRK